jgi:hypothetical protein
VVVDGSNAIHALVLSGGQHAGARDPEHRNRLLELIAAQAGEDWTVTFDDDRPAPAPRFGPLAIVHTPDADEWIVRAVERAPGTPIVVTSDRVLTERVRALGARVERPRAFIGSPPPGREP